MPHTHGHRLPATSCDDCSLPISPPLPLPSTQTWLFLGRSEGPGGGQDRQVSPTTPALVLHSATHAYPSKPGSWWILSFPHRFTCPFVEKFSIDIETFYKTDAGENPNVFSLSPVEKNQLTIGNRPP